LEINPSEIASKAIISMEETLFQSKIYGELLAHVNVLGNIGESIAGKIEKN
jgi:hypothetical protein